MKVGDYVRQLRCLPIGRIDRPSPYSDNAWHVQWALDPNGPGDAYLEWELEIVEGGETYWTLALKLRELAERAALGELGYGDAVRELEEEPCATTTKRRG